MQYFGYGIIVIIIFFVLINYLRKIHWDAVHNNLFDLVDELGGNVYRRGFLSRPVFHGSYKNCEVTINFSQERIKSSRRHFINISLGKKLKQAVTIASIDWINSRNESAADMQIIQVDGKQEYGIRINKLGQVKIEDVEGQLKNLIPFNFVFMGQTGLIFEKESSNLGMDTKIDKIKPDIEKIYNLSKLFH